MKLSRLITSKTSHFLHLHSPFLSYSGLTWYSTKELNPKRENNGSELYRRISPLGNPNESIVPALDQWISEGHPVTQNLLRSFIREFRHYRRFKHALEISQWMSDKRYLRPSVGDIAVRLDLIAKVHGIEQAENYFNNIPKQMRTVEVYGSLLNCYARGKCVDKADAIVQKITELGYTMCTINYNVLLNLYYQTENHEKFDALKHEMEVKQIKFDRHTYSIILNASAADSDVDKIEEVLKRIESDAEVDIDWVIYADIANRFIKAGSVDKALELLRKVEKLIGFAKKKNEAFSYLFTLYAAAGKKDEVLRVWNECKQFKVCNRDYISMLPSVLKFDDIETAEEIFSEWKSSKLNKDFRIPKILVAYYCKRGIVDKAEAIIESAKLENWEKPNAWTWYWMSLGYVKINKMAKAVETMEAALFEHIPTSGWKPDKETMMACLKYLKEEGNIERSGKFVRLLEEKDIISEEIKHKLLAYLCGDCGYKDGLVQKWCKGGDEDYGDLERVENR